MSLMVESMQELVQVKRRSGFDEDGEPEYAAAVDVYCKWTDGTETVTQRNAETVVTTSEVWLRPDADVNVGDILVRGGEDYEVVRSSKITDLGSAPAYLKVYV